MEINIIEGLFIRHTITDNSKQSIWCLHGFGDSGLAYKEVFESSLAKDFNIYVLDLPGFGVSPIRSDYSTINQQADLILKIIKTETTTQNQVNIIAHSLGALIGTWVCQQLGEKVNYYFNIEGNLTEADSYFSNKPLKFKTSQDFFNSFIKDIFEKAKTQESYKRYYTSLRFANPDALKNWGFTSQSHIKDNKCGFEFKNLTCNKIYMWGDLDTTEETQNFIVQHQIPHKRYKGIGHWHMVENSKMLYADIENELKMGSKVK